MNSLPFLIAALLVPSAAGTTVWAWWTMLRAETDLCREAGLEQADFDIGTWPFSAKVGCASG